MHQSKTLQNRTYPLLSSWLTGQGNSQHCTNRPYDRLSTEQPSSARYGLKSFLSCFCCYCFFIFGWLVWFGQLVDVCDVLFVCLSVCWGGERVRKRKYRQISRLFSCIYTRRDILWQICQNFIQSLHHTAEEYRMGSNKEGGITDWVMLL